MLPALKSLTDKQLLFAKLLAGGMPQGRATLAAGYFQEEDGHRLAQSPHIQAAVLAITRRKLLTEGAPIGLATLIEIASDKRAPSGARVQASNSLLDRAGFIAPKAQDAEGLQKELREMSPDELRAFIAEGQRRLADRAQLINAPNAPPVGDQVIEEYG